MPGGAAPSVRFSRVVAIYPTESVGRTPERSYPTRAISYAAPTRSLLLVLVATLSTRSPPTWALRYAALN